MDEKESGPQPHHKLTAEDGPQPGRPAPGRDLGIRQVRRLSNWTAAALTVAAAVTAGYFAHTTTHAAPAAPGSAGQTAAAVAAAGTHRPCISTPVAVSGGSGVTARAPVRACGSGSSAPVVVYAAPAGERGDS